MKSPFEELRGNPFTLIVHQENDNLPIRTQAYDTILDLTLELMELSCEKENIVNGRFSFFYILEKGELVFHGHFHTTQDEGDYTLRIV